MLGKLTLCCVYSSVLTTEGKPAFRDLVDSVEGRNGNQGIIETVVDLGCGRSKTWGAYQETVSKKLYLNFLKDTLLG